MNGCFRTLSCTAIFAVAVAAAPMSFAQEANGYDQAPQRNVDLSGVDLTTATGLDMARKRVTGAAHAVCASVIDLDGLALNHSACVLAARGQGVLQLEAMHQKALAAAATTTKAQYALRDRLPSGHKPD